MKHLLRTTTAYRMLAEEARRGEAPHAVLVVFPDEAYLRPLLAECAKALFCAEDGSREASLIEAENYADCLFFPARGGKLTVEDAGRIVDESQLRPVEGTKKLFVLDGFHRAAPLVQNKLLKSLEEPPAGVSFLLGAAAEFPVLPTVLSRVAKFSVSPFPEPEIASALIRAHPEAERSAVSGAAAASGGLYSAAEELLKGGGEEFLLAERFLGGEAVAVCRSLSDKEKGRAFFGAVRLLLRDMLFALTGQEKYAVFPDRAKRLSAGYTAGAVSAALSYVTGAEADLQFNANFGQCAFALSVKIDEEKQKWQKWS